MAGRDPLGPASPLALDPDFVSSEVSRFLREDVGTGDITTRYTVPTGALARGTIVAREECSVAGLKVAAAVFAALDQSVRFEAVVADGHRAARAEVVATLAGPAAPILTGERVALNLLQRLSGVATLTRRYLDAVEGTGVTISDTRKTTPGLRVLEKYAVRVGGGRNHRVGLFDAVLIKDNHIVAAGSLLPALRAVRDAAPSLPIQVEVESMPQLADALGFGVEAVLLDNMTPGEVREAVRLVRTHSDGLACWIEASGGITLSNVRRYAEAGVDTISIGALTHSAPAVDLALDLSVQ